MTFYSFVSQGCPPRLIIRKSNPELVGLEQHNPSWIRLRSIGPTGPVVGPKDTLYAPSPRTEGEPPFEFYRLFSHISQQTKGELPPGQMMKEQTSSIRQQRYPGRGLAGLEQYEQRDILPFFSKLSHHFKGYEASETPPSQKIGTFWLKCPYFFNVMCCHIFDPHVRRLRSI